MTFAIFILLVGLQRIMELYIAKGNERWMKENGGIEYGRSHYPWIVVMHVGFFLVLIMEVVLFDKGLSRNWMLWGTLFLVAQAIRIWALTSLGKYWNTKIIVIPNATAVSKGPYKFIKHPNYVIVAIEILVIPLLFNAYFTAGLFTLLNLSMMAIRIPAEERALTSLTRYEEIYRKGGRDS